MRYGIISDIHGNLEALETVLEALSEEEIDEYICGGDIVGYGADPSPCIDITRRLNPLTVCGNHDWATCGFFDIEYFNSMARQAVIWTRQVLSSAELDYLKTLSLTHDTKRFTLVHGSLDCPEQFGYILSAGGAHSTMRRSKTPLCFIGHSHVAGIFLWDGDQIEYTTKPRMEIKEDNKYVVNVGSVGQPRDGDSRASYAIYDDERGTVEIKRISYNIKKAQDKILKANLPPMLAYRLSNGL